MCIKTAYLITTVISLYMAYLCSFKLYEKGRYEQDTEWRRDPYPPIGYIFIFAVALCPVLNIVAAVIFAIFVLAFPEELKIDTWLFRTPERKDNAKQDTDNGK